MERNTPLDNPAHPYTVPPSQDIQGPDQKEKDFQQMPQGNARREPESPAGFSFLKRAMIRLHRSREPGNGQYPL